MPRQAFRVIERRRPPRIGRQELAQLATKRLVTPRRTICVLEVDQRAHERFGDEAAPKAAEVSAGIRERGRIEPNSFHDPSSMAALAAAMKRRTLSGSFLPGRASTPETTSTAKGRVCRTAVSILSGVNPPERMIGRRDAARRTSSHGIAARTSPSLQRAGESRRNAETV